MISSTSIFARLLFSIMLCAILLPALTAQAQQNNQTSQQETEDILRIRTELVQTDVLVLDKQGRFVDNLPREQFELKVDGKPQAISFFERVRTGSADEEAQLAAARGLARASTDKEAAVVHPVDRGRTIFFFIDDVHLSADSLGRARKVVLRFIDEEMSANDDVVIASASGQIGFLQQLTNNKAVLRAAVNRLGFKQYVQTRGDFPEISEYQAFTIQEQNDLELFNYFVGELLREDPMLRPEIAQTIIRNRVQTIANQATFYTTSALSSLETFMRSSAQVPGRKLFYFISDGFLLNIRSSNIVERMRHITDAALRSGSVIYTIEARGLALDPSQESTARSSFDLRGALELRSFAERSVPQEPLYRLAEDTGGRALLNTNALSTSVSQVLKETSAYYLLAWRPETSEQTRANKFRQIEVNVRDRPDLKVLVQRGYFDTPPENQAKPATAKNKNTEVKPSATPNTPQDELMRAVISQRQQTALRTSLSVGYTKEPQVGMMLTTSVEINDDALSSTQDAAKPAQNSIADLLAVVLNDHGKVVNGFKQQLTITPPASAASRERHFIVYSQRLPIAPGLYQIRVSARDRLSGRTGNAAEWIEIPDPNKGQFSLSSLFIGERKADNTETETATGPQQPAVVVLNPNRRFARNSRLRFNLQIYNAARNNVAPPDVAIQIQVFRGEQPVVTTALRKVSTEGLPDLSQLPYAAEVLLDKMPVGQYVLRVTAIDRIARASASQQINFAIE